MVPSTSRSAGSPPEGAADRAGARLTFEEDEVALIVFVHRVDPRGQAAPEVSDLHGVPVHDPVVPHPPEPLVLQAKHRKRQHRPGPRRGRAVSHTRSSKAPAPTLPGLPAALPELTHRVPKVTEKHSSGTEVTPRASLGEEAGGAAQALPGGGSQLLSRRQGGW